MEKQFPAFTVNYMDGNLPQCVIQLPEMRTLIASGNGFRGSIPLNTSMNLEVVDLSSNQFVGEIPKALLSVRSLRKLDLSFNNINGGVEVFNQLNSSANIVANMSIKVKLNKLSGQVPSLLGQLSSDQIDVLLGNVFTCGKGIPLNDPNHAKYNCGSAAFERHRPPDSISCK